jgi:hypothetical protein
MVMTTASWLIWQTVFVEAAGIESDIANVDRDGCYET